MDECVRDFGTVVWRDGAYQRESGTTGWGVRPILGFEGSTSVFPSQGLRLPLGQIEIYFTEPEQNPYTVIVSALHSDRMPSVAANYGQATSKGFVVHMWELAADRTLVNGSFSFVVFRTS